MNRLGVENVSAKKQEIANERASRRERIDPYAGLEGEIEINTGGARTAEEIEADVAALDKELEELTRKDDA